MRSKELPAIPSRNVLTMEIAPPTAASKLRATCLLSAIAASLTPAWRAIPCLQSPPIADTSACSTAPLAGSPAPPITRRTGRCRARARAGRSENHFIFLSLNSAILCARARTHRDDLDGAATTRGQRLTLTCNLGNKGGADCAQTGDTHFQGCGHECVCPWLAPRNERDDVVQLSGACSRNRRTLRAAWRIRCSFSTSAMRTKPSPYSPKPIPGEKRYRPSPPTVWKIPRCRDS